MHENIWQLVGPYLDSILPHYSDTLKRTVPAFLSLDPIKPEWITRPEATPMPTSLANALTLGNNIAINDTADREELSHGDDNAAISQSELSNIQDKAKLWSLITGNELRDYPKNRAWLQSGRDRQTAIWTRYAAGANPWTSLNDSAFTVALRCRLLLPVITTAGVNQVKCRRCKSVLDPLNATYHALECASRTDQITRRHNAIRDILFDFLQRILPVRDVEKEVPIAAEIAGKPDKRADITVKIDRHTFWVDITAGTPTSQAALAAGSAEKPGMAARLLGEAKEKDYRKSFHRGTVSANMIPFAVEATGRLGLAAKKFIEKVCKLEGALHIRDRNIKAERLFFLRRLNCAVHQFNDIILSSVEKDFERCMIPTAATIPQHYSPSSPDANNRAPQNRDITSLRINLNEEPQPQPRLRNIVSFGPQPTTTPPISAYAPQQPEHQLSSARLLCYMRHCNSTSTYNCNQCFGVFCQKHEDANDHHCDDTLGHVIHWKEISRGNEASISQLDHDLPTQSSPSMDFYTGPRHSSTSSSSAWGANGSSNGRGGPLSRRGRG